MILFAVFAALLAAIAPFAGMIFTIYFGLKYQDKLYVFFSVFIITTVILYVGKIYDPIGVLDCVIGIGLISFLFMKTFTNSFNYLSSLLVSAAAAIGYAVMRQLLFLKQLTAIAENAIIEYNKLLAVAFENNPEQLKFFTEASVNIKPLFTDYYIGIWSMIMISAIYIASLIISSRSMIKWQLRKIRIPYNIIYVLIVVLVALLIPNTRKYGLNGLMILAPFFLIEGISILHFHWGDFFQKSKFLAIILIASMVINPYLMILVMLIGLADIWFNFRKINNGG